MWACSRAPGSPSFLQFFGFLFVLTLATLTMAGKFPMPVLWVYLLSSCACFLLYAIDKWSAANSRRRIRETTLHLAGVCCGWPGALAAQRLLRHKSQKRPFLLLFRVTVMINCSALALWAGRWC